jgi:hypothetical protein
VRHANFEGWRIYANSRTPVVKLDAHLDLSEVRTSMGDFLSLQDDDTILVDWDMEHLLVLHVFGDFDLGRCQLRVWKISGIPHLIYDVQRDIECVASALKIAGNNVVLVPKYPKEVEGVIVVLDLRYDSCLDRLRFAF